ncbi:uncharacterized protein LOC34619082 [Cyclospora cayetanensis]|uniref:peptidylprolyl isomerase n=1 Tax=Cyclospora cayetanensis TaxID=88456 RepID=A0A6P6RRM2_9EIME|nr:uncharacterized protein LOC34619082 [Cyclospora cayetanensis]
MEEKLRKQNSRNATDVRHRVTPHEVDSREQSKQQIAPREESRFTLFGFVSVFLIFVLVGGLTCSLVVWSGVVVPRSSPSAPARTAHSAQHPSSSQQNPDTTFTEPPLPTMAPLTELKTSIIKAGSGPTVARSQRVTVHATGSVLQADGSAKKFWSTKDPGQQPFTWQAGLGQVIAGWDQGVLGMHLGEARMIYIPAKMGYGASGFPAWGIPPNADLQFEIECLQIQ